MVFSEAVTNSEHFRLRQAFAGDLEQPPLDCMCGAEELNPLKMRGEEMGVGHKCKAEAPKIRRTGDRGNTVHHSREKCFPGSYSRRKAAGW